MGPRWIRFGPGSGLLSVACLLAVTGCGGGGGGGSATTTPATTPATTSATTTPATTSATTTGRKFNIITWILDLGVGAPPGPQTAYFAAYEELRSGNCSAALSKADQVQDGAALVVAAARACLAARESSDDKRWAEAKAARDAVTDPRSLHCLDAAVYRLLDRLVRAHEKNPGGEFQFKRTGGGGAPPCPVITRITPRRGQAGQVVTIEGVNLDRVSRVDVEVESFVADFPPELAEGRLRVSMPDPQGSATACLAIVTPLGGSNWRTDGEVFTYESATESPATPDAAGAASSIECP